MPTTKESQASRDRDREEAATLGPSHEATGSYEGGRGVRHSVRAGRAWRPYLTKRQRTIRKNKVRLASTWGRVIRILKDTGMSMEEFVETLSAEELVRGQIKDKGGLFRGAPPQWVPRAFHRACIAELMRRGRYLWQENYLKAIETMTEIASGRGAGKYATPGERMKAAQFVIERLEGKIPERLMVVNDTPWQLVLDDIVADVPDEAIERGRKALMSAEASAQEILEAEVIDEEDYEPEDPSPRPVRSRRGRR